MRQPAQCVDRQQPGSPLQLWEPWIRVLVFVQVQTLSVLARSGPFPDTGLTHSLLECMLAASLEPAQPCSRPEFLHPVGIVPAKAGLAKLF